MNNPAHNSPHQDGLHLNVYRSPDNNRSLVILSLTQEAADPYVLCSAQGEVKYILLDEDGFPESAVSEHLSRQLLNASGQPRYRVVPVAGGFKGVVTTPGHNGDEIHFATMEIRDDIRTRTFQTEREAVSACFLLVTELGGIVAGRSYDDFLRVNYPGL